MRETAGVFCAGGEGKRYFGNTKCNFTQRSVNCSWRSGVSLEATNTFDHCPLSAARACASCAGIWGAAGQGNLIRAQYSDGQLSAEFEIV